MCQSGLFSIFVFERCGSIESSVKKSLHYTKKAGGKWERGEEGGGGGASARVSEWASVSCFLDSEGTEWPHGSLSRCSEARARDEAYPFVGD